MHLAVELKSSHRRQLSMINEILAEGWKVVSVTPIANTNNTTWFLVIEKNNPTKNDLKLRETFLKNYHKL